MQQPLSTTAPDQSDIPATLTAALTILGILRALSLCSLRASVYKIGEEAPMKRRHLYLKGMSQVCVPNQSCRCWC
jgi:hypothetical protein